MTRTVNFSERAGRRALALTRRLGPGWITLGALLLAFAVYYWQVLFGGRLVSAADLLSARYLPFVLSSPVGLQPSNPALADSVVSLAPAMTFVRESLASGQLPLWNPYTEFGMPFFAQSQWGILSPVQAPFLVPSSVYSIYTAQTLVGMLKILVAGSGAYLFARRLALSQGASAFASLAWAFGGYTTAWLSMPASAVTVFLPWICVALEDTLRGPRPWLAAAGLACAMTLSVAGGHPEALLYTFLAVAIYGVVRMLQERELIRRDWRRRLGAVGLAILLALGMSAVILLPAIELLHHSVDSTLRAIEERPTSMAWNSLIQVFSPDHFGGPETRGPFYSAFAAPWYAGVVAAVAAIVALLFRDRRALPFVVMALATLVIGMNTLPWRKVENAIELAGAMPKSAPLVMWAFALTFTAAIGVDRVSRFVSRRLDRSWLVNGLAAFLCVVLFIELYAWGHDYNPRVRRSSLAVPPPAQLSAIPAGVDAPRTVFLGHTLPFLLPMGYQRPEIRSYGQPTRTDYDEYMRRVVTNLDGVLNPSEIGYPVANLRPNARDALAAANTRYLAFSDGTWDLKGLRPVATGALNVFEDPRAMPRSFAISDYVVEPREDRALERLSDTRFDPRRQVILDRQPAGLAPSPTRTGATTRVTKYRNDHVAVDVATGRPVLLVLSDSDYPGWRAEVDGRHVPIYKANGLFRAVVVPSGRHTVKFDFQPRSVVIGFAISVVSILLTAALAIWARRRAPQPVPRG